MQYCAFVDQEVGQRIHGPCVSMGCEGGRLCRVMFVVVVSSSFLEWKHHYCCDCHEQGLFNVGVAFCQLSTTILQESKCQIAAANSHPTRL